MKLLTQHLPLCSSLILFFPLILLLFSSFDLSEAYFQETKWLRFRKHVNKMNKSKLKEIIMSNSIDFKIYQTQFLIHSCIKN